jgi:hypothetical protein
LHLLNGVWRPGKKQAPAGGGGANLFKMDFETMTATGNPITGSPNGQSATNNTGASGTVVTDPLGIHGKVWKVPYSVPVNGDDNRAISPQGFSVGLGDDIWFQGDVALDPAARMDTTGPGVVQRKFLYWGPLDLESGTFGFSFVLDSFSSQLAMNVYPHVTTNFTYDDHPEIYTVTAGTWNTVKVHLKINSSFAATDGTVRVWWNGNIVSAFDLTGVSWTDPTTWAGHDPSEFAFTNFGVGYQVDNANAGVPISEYRLWDNVSFATTEALL